MEQLIAIKDLILINYKEITMKLINMDRVYSMVIEMEKFNIRK